MYLTEKKTIKLQSNEYRRGGICQFGIQSIRTQYRKCTKRVSFTEFTRSLYYHVFLVINKDKDTCGLIRVSVSS